MPQTSSYGPSWQGSLHELAYVIYHIRRSRAFGRLSLRNTERLSVAYLYFRAGRLVQIVGNRGDNRAILLDLKEWTHASARFDRGVASQMLELGAAYEQLLDEVLLMLRKRGLVSVAERPRVIEGELIVTPQAKQLITPWEWRVLIEGTRRVSFAVAHLVGPKEAFNVLRDILDDCSSAFPAFASLKIAPSGYLQVADGSQLDRLSREDLLEGFAALLAICQYFCSPIIGEQNAHRLLVQALQDVGPALVSLGVFHFDTRLLSGK
ncbi:MAG: hypothetical protein NVS4B11_11350 [Ktedonobacteraceae bacterium]